MPNSLFTTPISTTFLLDSASSRLMPLRAEWRGEDTGFHSNLDGISLRHSGQAKRDPESIFIDKPASERRRNAASALATLRAVRQIDGANGTAA